MFGKPKAIIYLRRSSIELYGAKPQGSVEKLQIPAQLESSEEVLDQEGLKRLLDDFFTKVISQKQKTAIILSDELTFSKAIVMGQISKEQLEAQKKQFFETVPVDLHEVSRLEVVYKGKLYLIACNKKLYEDVVNSLSGLGRVVEFAVPAFIFGVSPNMLLTGSDISKILSDHQLIKMGNLLTTTTLLGENNIVDEPVSLVQPKTEVSAFDAKYFFIPVIVIIVIFAVVGGIIFLSGQNKSPINFTHLFGSATQKLSPSPIPSASAVNQEQIASDKGQITVEVINGTGKTGQAGKVKTMLEGLGFVDIVTGNVQGLNSTVTKVEFAGDVASGVVGEVEKELSTTFEKVETSKQASGSDYQIIITTGIEINP